MDPAFAAVRPTVANLLTSRLHASIILTPCEHADCKLVAAGWLC
jgi:hypothetical protein